MAGAAVRLLAVLPFEADAYRGAGADVVYVGHPAVDEAGAIAPRAALRGEWDVGEDTLVGLLPGSRVQEVRDLLPPMLEAVRALPSRGRPRCILPLASAHLRPHVEAALGRARVPVRIIDGRALDVMAASDALVVASGTAAVQAACAGTPMVVVYRVSRLTEWIARTFVLTPGAGAEGWSIPNIVLGRLVVPELVQRDVTGPRIRDELVRLLGGSGAALRGELIEVRRRLGPPGVMARAAGEVLRVLDRRGGTAIR
jgi:lipid-A-disaccharide synthase